MPGPTPSHPAQAIAAMLARTAWQEEALPVHYPVASAPDALASAIAVTGLGRFVHPRLQGVAV